MDVVMLSCINRLIDLEPFEGLQAQLAVPPTNQSFAKTIALVRWAVADAAPR